MDLAVHPQLTLRAGRQELAFGSSRLVSVREGPNVRQSFDGLRVMLTTAPWRIDAFVTLPVETNRRIFDDASDDTRVFWGLYVVHPLALLPKGNIDLYYLGLDSKQAEFDQGAAHEFATLSRDAAVGRSLTYGTITSSSSTSGVGLAVERLLPGRRLRTPATLSDLRVFTLGWG